MTTEEVNAALQVLEPFVAPGPSAAGPHSEPPEPSRAPEGAEGFGDEIVKAVKPLP